MSRLLAALVGVGFLLLGLLAALLASRTGKPLDWAAALLFLATSFIAWVRRPGGTASREERQRHLRLVFLWAGGALLCSFLSSVSV